MKQTYRIAMIDDDASFLQQLQDYGTRAGQELQLDIAIDTYGDGAEFIDHCKDRYDILFLDIEMPGMDGYKVAKRVREYDQSACIIFVTNMAQYAILGYEVNALDFMVKPFEYGTFVDKMRRAVRFCGTRRERIMVLERDDAQYRVRLSEIYYVSKYKNYLLFHTRQGEFRIRGTIAENERFLCNSNFAKISSGCLVNLKYVSKINKSTVWIGEEALPISRQMQAPFTSQVMRYLGGMD